MERLSEQIIEKALSLPEGAPIAAKALLHLGSRAAIDQALSRLRRRGQLLRAGRGLYVRPVSSRFGSRAPSVKSLLEAVATRSGETIVPSGAASANKLGLTTQVPVRNIYLTSGPSRELQLGSSRQNSDMRQTGICSFRNAPPAKPCVHFSGWDPRA
jgi:predicted transcriptional regulator of viral defense system